jgi:pyruvate/2-oxoglutarate dehydrogenase complex dihydrolipoamide dehydrogenase (E3) component
VPDLPGAHAAAPLTSASVWQLEALPPRLVVLGGGPIGVELGQAFARLGAEVVLVHRGDRLLPGEDPDASALLAAALRADGVDLRLGATATAVRGRSGGAVGVVLADGTEIEGTHLLVATGRAPHTAGLGLEAVGVAVDGGATGGVVVDAAGRTTSARVWAAGDVTGPPYYTHAAGMDGAAAAAAAVLGVPRRASRVVPRVTFTDPEVGAVGMTEQEARDAGLQVRTGIVQLPSVSRGWIHKAGNDGFIKVVADIERGVLIGATSAGPWGGEVLGALHVAVRGAVPIATLRHSMWAFPTFHRGIGDALADLDS